MATRLVLVCIHLKNTRREQKDHYHCTDLVSIPGKSFRAFWKMQVQTEAKSPTPALSSVTPLLKAVPVSAQHHTQPNLVLSSLTRSSSSYPCLQLELEEGNSSEDYNSKLTGLETIPFVRSKHY